MKHFGKLLKSVCKIFVILFLVLFAALVLLFVLSPVIDDIALNHYEEETTSALELPPDTKIIGTVSKCGNTSGTGNHTEMYLAVLVKTSLSEKTWNEYGFISHSVSADGEQTYTMKVLNLDFPHMDEPDGCYILEYAEDAPCSSFDLRGH